MAGEYNEPTRGDRYTSQRPIPQGSPPSNSGPNQRSMPMPGSRYSASNIGGKPHTDYHRQATQHFGPGFHPMAPQQPLSYPAVTAPTSPGVPPGYTSYSPPTAKDSFIIRLMERGVRGELFQQPWFHNFRAHSPDPFVFTSYAVGVVLTILLALIPSSLFSTVFSDALWVAIGYLYLALGTKLAHQFLEFGICLVGTLVMLGRIWSTAWAIAIDRSVATLIGVYAEPTALLVFELLLNVAAAAFLIYVGLQIHRGIQRLSAP